MPGNLAELQLVAFLAQLDATRAMAQAFLAELQRPAPCQHASVAQGATMGSPAICTACGVEVSDGAPR